MADGDEKIDHNDRVLILNRVTDARWEGMFNGITLVWAPGQIRSIQKDEATHYIQQSRVIACPMNTYFPVQRLVLIDEQRRPLEAGASADPLTEAECRELRKKGSIDPTYLPPDRL